jgi:hypothetical protein
MAAVYQGCELAGDRAATRYAHLLDDVDCRALAQADPARLLQSHALSVIS